MGEETRGRACQHKAEGRRLIQGVASQGKKRACCCGDVMRGPLDKTPSFKRKKWEREGWRQSLRDHWLSGSCRDRCRTVQVVR